MFGHQGRIGPLVWTIVDRTANHAVEQAARGVGAISATPLPPPHQQRRTEACAVCEVCAPPPLRKGWCGGGRVELGRDVRLTRKKRVLSASDAVSSHKIHETGRNEMPGP